MSSGDRRSITYQAVLLYIALPLLFSIGGFLMRDLYAEVKTVRTEKLDRTEFYQAAVLMDKKMDLIIQLLRDHEANSDN